MPISSVIAIPFEVEKEEQEESMLQQASGRNGNPKDALLSKKMILRLKCFELITTGVIAALFLYDVGKSEQREGDLLVAGFLGALLMCPFLLIMIPEYNGNVRNMFTLTNFICSLMLFTIGYMEFVWWRAKENEVIADAIDANDAKTRSVYLKLLFAIAAFFIGTTYACEVCIQIIDNFKRMRH